MVVRKKNKKKKVEEWIDAFDRDQNSRNPTEMKENNKKNYFASIKCHKNQLKVIIHNTYYIQYDCILYYFFSIIFRVCVGEKKLPNKTASTTIMHIGEFPFQVIFLYFTYLFGSCSSYFFIYQIWFFTFARVPQNTLCFVYVSENPQKMQNNARENGRPKFTDIHEMQQQYTTTTTTDTGRREGKREGERKREKNESNWLSGPTKHSEMDEGERDAACITEIEWNWS